MDLVNLKLGLGNGRRRGRMMEGKRVKGGVRNGRVRRVGRSVGEQNEGHRGRGRGRGFKRVGTAE